MFRIVFAVTCDLGVVCCAVGMDWVNDQLIAQSGLTAVIWASLSGLEAFDFAGCFTVRSSCVARKSLRICCELAESACADLSALVMDFLDARNQQISTPDMPVLLPGQTSNKCRSHVPLLKNHQSSSGETVSRFVDKWKALKT